jgi:hypothetical protein
VDNSGDNQPPRQNKLVYLIGYKRIFLFGPCGKGRLSWRPIHSTAIAAAVTSPLLAYPSVDVCASNPSHRPGSGA